MDDPTGGSTYRIFGRALPERRAWWFDPIEIRWEDSPGRPLVRMTAAADLSNFSATYWLGDGVSFDLSPADARNHLRGFVRVMLDVIGLLNGAAVDCDVVQFEGPGGVVTTLDSTFEGLAVEYDDEQFQRIAKAGHSVRGLRLGMADFRLAVAVPEDTLFLCYRGVDGIRADLMEAESITSDATAWERAREVTGLTLDEIIAIKPQADARRHGGFRTASHEEREAALRLLQRALLRYAEWSDQIPS